jgi:hypothetical protein
LVSRRQLLGASGAAGLGLTLAGCGGKSGSSAATIPVNVDPGHAEAINRLLDVEWYAAAAYTAGVPLLKSHNLRLAKRFLNQELSHIAVLTQLLKKIHSGAHGEAPSYELGSPRSETEVLELFERIEQLSIRTYLDAIRSVPAGSIQSTFVSILANEAQHISIVRRNLGRAPVPTALLTAAE